MNPHQIPLPDLTYPTAKYVRHSATSREAAESVTPHLGPIMARVYEWYQGRGEQGGTDEELALSTGIPPNTSRARRIDLTDRGYLCDSGEKRLTRSGRKAVVWRVVEGAGR